MERMNWANILPEEAFVYGPRIVTGRPWWWFCCCFSRRTVEIANRSPVQRRETKRV